MPLQSEYWININAPRDQNSSKLYLKDGQPFNQIPVFGTINEAIEEGLISIPGVTTFSFDDLTDTAAVKVANYILVADGAGNTLVYEDPLNLPVSNDVQVILDTKIETIGQGTHITVDATDPKNPIVSYSGPVGVDDHTLLSNIGANSHDQIDSHIASVANPHSVTKDQVGLGNVPNVDTTNASNITTGVLPTSVIPPIAIGEVFEVASEVEQLALTAQTGDVAIRIDESKTYMKNSGTSGTMTDWTELLFAGGAGSVISVNGQTGVVVLTTTNIAEGTNEYYTEAKVSANSDVAANTAARHTHANKALLDTYTQSNADIANAISNTHASSLLGTITVDETDLANGKVLVYNSTSGNLEYETPSSGVTDHTLLSNIGTNTHVQIDNHIASTSNPHSVTKAQVGLSDVPNLNTTDAVANEHTHANKAILDATTASYTTIEEIKLTGIEPFATADQSAGEIQSLYYSVEQIVTQPVAEAGSSISSFRWTPQRVKQAIISLAPNTTDHLLLTNIGTNSHADIDSHIADSTIHFSDLSGFDTDGLSEGTTNIYNKIPTGGTAGQLIEKVDGTDYNVQWVSPSSLGFATNLQDAYDNSSSPEIVTDATNGAVTIRRGSASDNDLIFTIENGAGSPLIGGNGNGVWACTTIQASNNAQITGSISVGGTVDGRDVAADGTAQDNHIADSTIHFTEASIDHTNIANIGTNTHAQIDSHIGDSSIHFTENPNWNTAYSWGDHSTQGYLTTHDGNGIFTSSNDGGTVSSLFNVELTDKMIFNESVSNGITIDGANNRLGIRTTGPTEALHVQGAAIVTSRGGTADGLLGVLTSSGKLVDVTLGSGLSLTSGTLSATASGTAWGDITGTLSNQTDLQSALDGKASTSHTHTASDVTDFDTEVANNTAVTANTAKVTNATHTGEVTGSTSLTLQPSAITNRTATQQ
jgi:hypothetical protein